MKTHLRSIPLWSALLLGLLAPPAIAAQSHVKVNIDAGPASVEAVLGMPEFDPYCEYCIHSKPHKCHKPHKPHKMHKKHKSHKKHCSHKPVQGKKKHTPAAAHQPHKNHNHHR